MGGAACAAPSARVSLLVSSRGLPIYFCLNLTLLQVVCDCTKTIFVCSPDRLLPSLGEGGGKGEQDLQPSEDTLSNGESCRLLVSFSNAACSKAASGGSSLSVRVDKTPVNVHAFVRLLCDGWFCSPSLLFFASRSAQACHRHSAGHFSACVCVFTQ